MSKTSTVLRSTVYTSPKLLLMTYSNVPEVNRMLLRSTPACPLVSLGLPINTLDSMMARRACPAVMVSAAGADGCAIAANIEIRTRAATVARFP